MCRIPTSEKEAESIHVEKNQCALIATRSKTKWFIFVKLEKIQILGIILAARVAHEM